MAEDSIVNEIRKIRENLEAKFDFDQKAIFKDIRKRQATIGPRLIRHKKKLPATKKADSKENSSLLHPGR